MLDFDKEVSIGIRGDPAHNFTELNPGEVWVTDLVAKGLKLHIGDQIYIGFSDKFLEGAIGEAYAMKTGDSTARGLMMQLNFTIAGIVPTFVGRLPGNNFYSMAVIADYKGFSEYLEPYINQNYKNQEQARYKQFLKTVVWEDFCNEVIVNFENRMDIYFNDNYENILAEVVPLASKITETLSPYALKIELPIVETLNFTRFANTFISLVMNLVLSGLLFLACYVIYNIMLISVDSKVYESAVQRTIGLTRRNLISMMVINCLGYSVLAMLLGFPATHYTIIEINRIINETGESFTLGWERNAIIISISLSIHIPMVSGLSPLLGLLKQNIAFALDKDHSKTSSLKVSVHNEKEAFSWENFAIATGSAVIGASIYILLPLSLFTGRITLFITIFFGLLMCMLVGLMLIFVNFTYVFEMIIMIPLFLERKFVRTMVRMNLVAHRLKNRRTVIIYGLSLSFINFVYVVLIMQIGTSQVQQLRGNGSPLTVVRNDNNKNGLLLHQWQDMFENEQLGDAATYSMVLEEILYPMNASEYRRYTLFNRGKLRSVRNPIVAPSPNYKDVAQVQLNVRANDGVGSITSMDRVQYVYTSNRPGSAILSKSVRDRMMVDCEDDNDGLNMDYQRGRFFYNKEFTCAAASTTMSGFFMSRLPTNLNRVDLVTSFPTYLSVMNFTSAYNLKYISLEKVMIKLKDDGLNKNQTKILEKNVMGVLKANSKDLGYWVFSFSELVESFKRTNRILDLLFYVIIFISMALSLFSLMSTMASNIMEQKKELAIMRCMGLRRCTIARIYLYESIVVIMTGGVIGLSVGILMGWTIVAQNALFTNSQANLVFPWDLLGLVFVFSVLSSVVAAMIPAYRNLMVDISKLIKEN